ncbi:DUF11 domain-containing protein [Altererythrobacter halimionae]|uniref:DUF11 domain-containing protein n=1 Tax=Alteriqipengyuania halimionae TaxID=1926630 RepID=A0A6I4U3U9_9SPHN|nr:DUF11 domain-containing protein [Alteriqipengyuania halimionae]
MWDGKLTCAASALAVACLLSPSDAHADGVRAGTLINNTASATYTDGTGPKTVDSNTVTVTVDELLDVALAWQDGAPLPIGGGSAILAYKLTNTGNAPEAFNLRADPAVAGNDFDTTLDSIAYDTNNNGLYDAGVDVILALGDSTPEIDADESLVIFVLVSGGASAADGDTSDVKVNAEAVTGTGSVGTVFAGKGLDGTDAVVGTSGADADMLGGVIASIAGLDLVKSAAIVDSFGGNQPLPGARVTYTLVATVSGSGSISNLRITDAIPSGTSYAAGSLTLDTAALTDAEDGDAGKVDASGVDVLVGNAAAGNAFTVTFDVIID